MHDALLLSEPDAAKLLAISPKTLSRLVTAGRMPVVRLGHRKLYDQRDLVAFIDQSKSSTNPAPHGETQIRMVG